MAITPPSPQTAPAPDKQQEKKIDAWINSAPDGRGTGAAEPKHVMKGRKRQISVTFELDQLDKLDAFAAANNLKRNAAIELSVRQMLRDGITVHHRPVVEEE